ncbi:MULTISPECIES: hypothetical protein [Burkholderia cepacia complex]|uniref:hypothetical protein n=1 Tax=Burkholderia cepacia complex TaxID=87882 RepID=UPI000F5769AE|nr:MULTISPECIES: hypothetical protein [Burkholderia cepacia complex]MBN3533835.1 hypothetical protein [Burkholderia cenocepacia]RQQ49614.1 hypothetical protein DF145_15510 [Burkholderia stagnalis]RQY00497.1 hypothetical protein DF121_15475 [Burkholderia stagnalis]RQY15757.1 hypothetical protein DF115_17640 [Burkholderia stagnalis]RQY29884.1 hypothetical protein DF114_18250 [Burkholderia stagnalis]
MKNARPSKAESSAKRQSEFTGTKNPRHLRALTVLQRRPMPREELDHFTGCSNSPALIASLRARGLMLPCERVPYIDRDGREVHRGVYRLTTTDRRKLARWIKVRGA